MARDPNGARVRQADAGDAAACAEIYAPYVTDSAITFELQPPSADEMAERIGEANRRHVWVVLEDAGRVAGYAYGGVFNRRAAYRWSCEVSIYVERGRRRTGAGRALYTDLLARLAARGYRIAAAGMTLPNEASAGLHASLGFEPVGVFRSIGFKDGRWHDVQWLQRTLGDGPIAGGGAPAEPS